eukprot:6221697-Alexandrium_andersonii.AAC.1
MDDLEEHGRLRVRRVRLLRLQPSPIRLGATLRPHCAQGRETALAKARSQATDRRGRCPRTTHTFTT